MVEIEINYLVLCIGPLQDGRDAVNVQGVLGCILPIIQSFHMSVLFGRQAGPKHANCNDPIRLSEWHLFAHQRFSIVGVSVLGAETLGQFVLVRVTARFGFSGFRAGFGQVIGIAHGRKVNRVNDRQCLGIENSLPATDPHRTEQSATKKPHHFHLNKREHQLKTPK